MVDDYWNSDHHRFEWTNFMQKLDPLSWHSLAISHPDSFLKGKMILFFVYLPLINVYRLEEKKHFQSNDLPFNL